MLSGFIGVRYTGPGLHDDGSGHFVVQRLAACVPKNPGGIENAGGKDDQDNDVVGEAGDQADWSEYELSQWTFVWFEPVMAVRSAMDNPSCPFTERLPPPCLRQHEKEDGEQGIDQEAGETMSRALSFSVHYGVEGYFHTAADGAHYRQ